MVDRINWSATYVSEFIYRSGHQDHRLVFASVRLGLILAGFGALTRAWGMHETTELISTPWLSPRTKHWGYIFIVVEMVRTCTPTTPMASWRREQHGHGGGLHARSSGTNTLAWFVKVKKVTSYWPTVGSSSSPLSGSGDVIGQYADSHSCHPLRHGSWR
jgi:hypothetical protein